MSILQSLFANATAFVFFHGAEFVCKNVGDGGDKQKYCPRFQCCQ